MMKGQNAILSAELGASSNISHLTFGVPLPQNVDYDMDLVGKVNQMMMNDAGIVGTIVFLKNAAMIWLGWGAVDCHGVSGSVEGQGIPVMGSLVVGFPRTKYKGFGDGEVSCSQLVGGDSEDQILGWQMAGRLSQQFGYPIFVSCGLFESDPPEWMKGLDKGALAQRAAAMAERKVKEILKERRAGIQEK
jgi:Proteasome assembly chaperone 4